MDPPPPPADTPPQCSLLVGVPALAAQAVLAVLAFAALVYKRQVERPQRPVNVWALDVSKQAVSMLAAHICGMAIAVIAHHQAEGEATSQCSWYMVAYTFDTSLGVAFTVLLHRAALRLAAAAKQRAMHGAAGAAAGWATGSASLPGVDGGQHHWGYPGAEPWHEALLQCGNYGDPPSLRRWALQMGEWVTCVVGARALCGGLVLLLSGLLVALARGLDALFAGHPTALLFFVMVCCPLAMNAVQLLVQDAVLKWKRRGSKGGDAALGGDEGLDAVDYAADSPLHHHGNAVQQTQQKRLLLEVP